MCARNEANVNELIFDGIVIGNYGFLMAGTARVLPTIAPPVSAVLRGNKCALVTERRDHVSDHGHVSDQLMYVQATDLQGMICGRRALRLLLLLILFGAPFFYRCVFFMLYVMAILSC